MENLEKIWKNHGKIMEFQNENLVATLNYPVKRVYSPSGNIMYFYALLNHSFEESLFMFSLRFNIIFKIIFGPYNEGSLKIRNRISQF